MKAIQTKAGKIGLALLLLTCLELAWITSYSFQRMPSFDGSMNLQVAWSLSKGEGYRRSYAEGPLFPPEVQTNAPLTVPAALVFRLLGMGTVQAQLVNLLYLYGLIALCFALLFKRFGWLPAGACALLLAATPGIIQYGMNGYGELIGLFWFVASLAAYPWTGHRMHRSRVLLAGACLGLALCTKIVLAICVAAFLLAILIVAILDGEKRWGDKFRDLVLVALGLSVPILGFEAWRLVSLGGIAPYQDWWGEQLTAVGRQAGVVSAYRDTPDLWAKLRQHMGLLAHFYGLSVPMSWAWILSPVILFVSCFRFPVRRKQGIILCVILAVAIYFVWWLAVTPSQKAWHRRILNGAVLLNFAWAYVAAQFLELRTRFNSSWLRRAFYIPVLLTLGLALLLFVREVAPELAKGPGQHEDVQRALQLLKSLPGDARIHGIGWYSAPTLSLFSTRPLDDFNKVIIEGVDRSKPVYVVLDESAIAAGKGDLTVSTYRSRPLLQDARRVQIYEVDLGAPNSEVPKDQLGEAAPIVDLTTNTYPFLGGFYGSKAAGGRWMTSDAFVDLLYEGSPNIAMTLAAAPMPNYIHGGGVRLTFSVNGREIGSARIKEKGKKVIELEIPENSRPQIGEVATVRISSDNLVNRSIMTDDRAMSVIAMNIGFVAAPSDLETPQVSEREPIPGPGFRPTANGIGAAPETVLQVRPDPVDFCASKRRVVEVTWDMSAAKTRAVQIWLEEPGGRRKLWIETADKAGRKTSGNWIVEGMKFIALDVANGKVLNTAVVRAAECNNQQ